MQISLFQWKLRDWRFFPAPALLSPGDCEFRIASLFALACQSQGHKPYWPSELGVLGYHLFLGSLKSQTATWCPNPSLLGEKLGVGGPFLTVWHYVRGQVYGKVYLSLSYPFWCGHFLIHLMCRNDSSSFSISFRRNYPVCSIHSVSPQEERTSEAFPVAILVDLERLAIFPIHWKEMLRQVSKIWASF